jgi:hypothetical protein
VTRIIYVALAAVVAASTQSSETSRTAGTGLPPRLERYLTTAVRLTPAERKRLFEGVPITKLLDTDEAEEVAVFGAIWINAPIRQYVEAVQDIENFERGGGFRVTKRISMPPMLEDFADRRLPDEDIAALRTCRIGDCDVKPGLSALERFGTDVNWTAGDSRPAADALMRRLTLDYVNGYLEGGNERLAMYRDDSRPTYVADEFRAIVDRMPELTSDLPALRR